MDILTQKEPQMKITITVPKHVIKSVKEYAKELNGKVPSKKELMEFFEQDIEGLYGDTFEEGIEGAVENYFG
jgi:ABC-type phosphate/phosphonate transport system ATPase subunit